MWRPISFLPMDKNRKHLLFTVQIDFDVILSTEATSFSSSFPVAGAFASAKRNRAETSRGVCAAGLRSRDTAIIITGCVAPTGLCYEYFLRVPQWGYRYWKAGKIQILLGSTEVRSGLRPGGWNLRFKILFYVINDELKLKRKYVNA